MRVSLIPPAAVTANFISSDLAHANWQSALDVHGTQASSISWLIYLFFLVCGAIWILVVGTLVLALLRKRSPVELRSSARLTIAVSAAVAATVLIVTGLTIASYVATRGLDGGSADAVLIEMRGHQWWWEAVYKDRDGQFTTANELHIPVNRPVRIKLEAVDVIHSFWVPSLAGKMDMIPGRENEVTFTAQREGVYRGQCAEFCGIQHAHMGFLVVAESQDGYATWRRKQSADAREPADEEQRRGREIFLSRQCAACHVVRGTSAKGRVGPDLTHIGGRQTIAAGVLPQTRGSLAAWTADPQTIKPGNNMPMVPLSAEELKAVSAWMAGLQ